MVEINISNLFSQVYSTKSHFLFQLDPTKMDRVELAFRKFDTNNDGYLTRDEFDVVS